MRQDYIAFLSEKKGFDPNLVIYPDTGSYYSFLSKLMSDELSVYYGCLRNDSIEMIKSAFLKENLSCAGRILEDVQRDAEMAISGKDSLFIKSDFRNFCFRYLKGDEKFNINLSKKKLKIILVYGYATGIYFDDYYKEVNNYFKAHQEDIDLFIVSMDPVSKLR